MLRKLLLFSALVFLSGCGNYFSVRIPYIIPEGPGAAANRSLLSRIYILARFPAPREENVLTGIAAALANSPVPDMDGGSFTKRLAASFRRPGVSVAAYRTIRAPDNGALPAPDKFIERLRPASVLEVSLGAPHVSIRKEKRKVVYAGKDKQSRTVENTVWVYSVSLSGQVKLSSYPGFEARDNFSDTFVYSEERTDDSRKAGEFYEDSEEKVFSAVCARIVKRYLGQPVQRFRPVFFKKENADLKKAAEYAQAGRWGQAKELWEKNLSSADGWRAAFGLAVASELDKDYAAAAGLYRRAKEKSGGDKDAGRVFWAGIFSDLDYMLSISSVPAATAPGWFERPTALLPFSEQTNSVDGPPMVREMLAGAIKDAGYALQDPEETDRILKGHGYSDGGQLGAVGKADLCRWLGVERLIYGDISEFGEVMAGLYNRRAISGSFAMLELDHPAQVWIASETVAKVKTPKSLAAGFFSQLAKGLWERIKNKPLAEESALFVKRVAETLPNKAR